MWMCVCEDVCVWWTRPQFPMNMSPGADSPRLCLSLRPRPHLAAAPWPPLWPPPPRTATGHSCTSLCPPRPPCLPPSPCCCSLATPLAALHSNRTLLRQAGPSPPAAAAPLPPRRLPIPVPGRPVGGRPSDRVWAVLRGEGGQGRRRLGGCLCSGGRVEDGRRVHRCLWTAVTPPPCPCFPMRFLSLLLCPSPSSLTG